jgi:cephalosporin-C deacetylase-like acetyl esterase
MRRHFKPPLTRPADFELFWDSTQRQLERQVPAIERSPLETQVHAGLIGEQVSFLSLGGVRITAGFIHWQDDRARPLVIYSHGYGGQCRPRWDWAARGLNVFGVDIRGFGRSRAALPEPSPRGYVLTGIETPEASVLRTAVCDYMQAARVACSLLDARVARTVFHGVSFAGGLALMAEAVLNMADLLVAGVPTFGWAGGRHVFVKSGSGAEINRYLEERPEQLEDVMLVLRYFDTVNFADCVHCPTLVGIGLQDEVVPAKTVYGIANHLAGPHEIMEFPVSHTDRPEEQLWEKFETCWLELAMHDVPDGFGQQVYT